MTGLLFVLLLAALGLAVVMYARLKTTKASLQELRKRYGPALDVDRYVKAAKSAMADTEEKMMQAERTTREKGQELKVIEEALRLRGEAGQLLEVGYYEPIYGFEDLPRYEQELARIKRQQKQMLQTPGERGDELAAAYCTTSIQVNGSSAEGQALARHVLILMLRAFNGECDAFIAKVNYRNVNTMEKRIQSAYDQINKVAKSWNCTLSGRYLVNRLGELQLVYEYEEAKQKEKEEQAQIKEQIREDERAERERQKAEQKAEEERAKYQELLQKAQKEATAAADEDKAALNERISELQARLTEAEEKKRAISQAQITRAGFVYIISNLGSFGSNVFKIGMTRREKPTDRVKELGDASVPFPFDIHALISTDDAPRLESALHKHFDSRRVNLENQRKEFFRVTIEEIRDELEKLKEELGIDAGMRLTLLAEAKEYRLSEAKRKHLEKSYQQSGESVDTGA